jgi:hypothetical protein
MLHIPYSLGYSVSCIEFEAYVGARAEIEEEDSGRTWQPPLPPTFLIHGQVYAQFAYNYKGTSDHRIHVRPEYLVSGGPGTIRFVHLTCWAMASILL